MIGYIDYNGKIIKVNILEKKSQHTLVETEDNELLCIPVESGAIIWPTREECEAYRMGVFFTTQNN